MVFYLNLINLNCHTPLIIPILYPNYIPPDVILLGENKVVVGVAEWPTFTLESTIDQLDTLDHEFCDDFDRVSKNLKTHKCTVYTFFICIVKCHSLLPLSPY